MWRIIILLCVLGATAAHAADNQDWAMVKWFNSRLVQAEQGNKHAQYDVGMMYEKGRGTDRSARQAVHWLRMSARQGQATAIAELGILYFQGRTVAADYPKAFSLLSSAANQNIPNAQFYLGRVYELGKGTRRNLDVALSWYRRAAKNGYYPARGKIGELQALIRLRQKARAANIRHIPKTTAARSVATTHPARPAVAAPIKALSPAATLRRSILAAHWTNRQHPVGYLPSTLTVCKDGPQGSLLCLSRTQKRSTGQAMISYRTRATLSGFKKKGIFQIRYTNEIMAITPIKRASADILGSPVAPPRLRNDAEHNLRCRYNPDQSISCIKDRIFKLRFTQQVPQKKPAPPTGAIKRAS